MKMKRKQPEIKIIIESSLKLDKAYGEIDDFIIGICKKYRLNYYEIFGLIESLKLNYNDELKDSIEEEG